MPKRALAFQVDPTTPHLPPRPVIVEKRGFWDKFLAPPNANNPNALPNTAPSPAPAIVAPPAPLPLTPFPHNYHSLRRVDRRAWDAQREKEVKSWKQWERACKAAVKADEMRKKREEGEKKRKEREEARAKAKDAKIQAKLGYRPLPNVNPSYPYAYTLPIPIAPAAAAPPGMPSMPVMPMSTPMPMPTQKPPGTFQPTSWMLLPTLEEFGIRRPFDAPGRPEGLGGKSVVEIGGVEWPKMSRTMTHAISDMSAEERIHMSQAGHPWAPTSGWYND